MLTELIAGLERAMLTDLVAGLDRQITLLGRHKEAIQKIDDWVDVDLCMLALAAIKSEYQHAIVGIAVKDRLEGNIRV